VPITNRQTLRAYARLGAMRRLEELRQEEAAIRAVFPDLFGRGRRRGMSAVAADEGNGQTPQRRRRRRGGMSAAQRKAVSERMKKYWAARRKARG
jgi:hypothetical protein